MKREVVHDKGMGVVALLIDGNGNRQRGELPLARLLKSHPRAETGGPAKRVKQRGLKYTRRFLVFPKSQILAVPAQFPIFHVDDT